MPINQKVLKPLTFNSYSSEHLEFSGEQINRIPAFKELIFWLKKQIERHKHRNKNFRDQRMMWRRLTRIKRESVLAGLSGKPLWALTLCLNNEKTLANGQDNNNMRAQVRNKICYSGNKDESNALGAHWGCSGILNQVSGQDEEKSLETGGGETDRNFILAVELRMPSADLGKEEQVKGLFSQ